MCVRCDYSASLENSDLPVTPRRLLVLEVVGNSSYPLSPQEIFETVRRSHSMNRVTLYRILDLLVEKELVERISSGDRTFRYGPAPSTNHPPHPHFFCTRCRSMECLRPEALPLDVRSLQRTFPALIEKVEIRLDGICSNCLRKKKARSRRPSSRRP